MYTVEIYKADKRRSAGERRVHKRDYETKNLPALKHFVDGLLREGERYEIHQTWVIRENMMTGDKFKERYDRPTNCSPASESYWST